MKVSRTLITVALCLVSLGHSGRGVLGDNSVWKRLSTQEDVSAGMLGVSDQDEPVYLGFFGSLKYAFTEFYSDTKLLCISIVLSFIVALVGIVSGIAVASAVKGSVSQSAGGFTGAGYLLTFAVVSCIFLVWILIAYYFKPSRPVP